MIDFGAFSVMFKDEFAIKISDGEFMLDPEVLKRLGVRLNGQIDFDEDGNTQISRLTHHYESIPSSFASIAFCIVDGSDFHKFPYIRICGCPAKVLQGHNVFGSDNPDLCFFAVLEAFMLAMPELANYLDWPTTSIDYFDITYTARVVNDNNAVQVINMLKNVRSGQTKNRSTDDHLTTVTWGKASGRNGKSSRRKQLKAYMKFPELQHQIRQLEKRLKQSKGDPIISEGINRQLSAIQHPTVQHMAMGAIRFESRLFGRWLKDRGINTNLFTFINHAMSNPTLLTELWRDSWKDVFATFEGASMNLNDHNSVLETLKSKYMNLTPKGNISFAKAEALFAFYCQIESLGYEKAYSLNNRMKWSRYSRDLMAAGISKAQLQNMTGQQNNVVPLIRLINIDFSAQLPANWKEPLPLRQQIKQRNPLMKLAS